MTTGDVTVASAPGKVLLAGGYLILDRQHTGLVLGLNARIFVAVESASPAQAGSAPHIRVRSPQFVRAEWLYHARLMPDDGGIKLEQAPSSPSLNSSPNPFVETALAYALTYAVACGLEEVKPLRITILADTDYYSRPGQAWEPAAEPGSRFVRFDAELNKVHKTGLGSSAALVTALVASILYHHLQDLKASPEETSAIGRIHRLAQAAHCAAQGKIGSGFDVAAAVFGSCVYRRFSPSLLDRLESPGVAGFSSRLRSVVDDRTPGRKWDYEVASLAGRWPQGLRLVMCDVDRGSETRGMVKKVLAWRLANPADASHLWQRLQQETDKLIAELQRLASEAGHSFGELRHIILSSRSLVREMSVAADIPIEPQSQTQLLDACSQLQGVVGGVIPGAGGYDALAFIVEDGSDTVATLEANLSQHPLEVPSDQESTSAGYARILKTSQESRGIRLEPVDATKYWLDWQ